MICYWEATITCLLRDLLRNLLRDLSQDGGRMDGTGRDGATARAMIKVI